jgi:hypothetical protein
MPIGINTHIGWAICGGASAGENFGISRILELASQQTDSVPSLGARRCETDS